MKSYFDLQVNGYAGFDFNDAQLSANDWHVACQRLRDDGVQGVLVAVITDELGAMCRCLEHIAKIRESDSLVRDVVFGFHIEGPFLSAEPGYIGAHPAHFAIPADIDAMQQLLESANGLARLVTLAPECDPGFKTTRYLAKQGITVSAGHCNPSIEQLHGALDSGLRMFTHLGNGCPMMLNRHDNVIQRVLSVADRLWVTFIADGVHVPFVALKNYLQLVGTERAVVVTDAMAASGMGPGRYRLGHRTVEVGRDLAAWAEDRSHLVGSASTMPSLERNLREHLGFCESDIARLLYENPLAVMNANSVRK